MFKDNLHPNIFFYLFFKNVSVQIIKNVCFFSLFVKKFDSDSFHKIFTLYIDRFQSI